MKNITKLFNNILGLKLLLSKESIKNIIVCTFILIIFSILNPIITWIYKTLIDNINLEYFQIIRIIIFYVSLQLIIEVLELIQSHLELKTSYNVNNSLIELLNNKLSRIRLEELENPDTYDLLDRIYTTVANGALSFISTLLGLTSPIISTITYSLLLIQIKWYMPMLIIFTSIPYFFVIIKNGKENYQQQVEQNKRTRQLEYLIGVLSDRKFSKEIRLFNLVDYFIIKITALRDMIFKEKIALMIKQSIKVLSITILRNTALGLCLFITCYNILKGNGKIGDVFLAIAAIQSIVGNITSLISSIASLNNYTFYIDDLKKLNNLEDVHKKKQNSITDFTITFNNVSFKYPKTETEILKGLNVKINPQEKIAIVGENGSGKTTFINLLLGIYEPTGGSIKVGDYEMLEVIDEFRKYSVAIFQNFIKYQFSVNDNIKAGNFGNEVNYNLLSRFDMKDFLDSLPEGIESLLGQMDDNSYEVSGGEWQRIAIARALSREDAKILIMDEPTASLDPQIENKIYEEFTEFCAGKTVVLISHRLSAAKLCDRILVFEKGTIIEEGSHSQLMNLKGKYFEMFSVQSHLYL